jgi:2-(1,2-epoxy-1,2-dihydrophenyl)acetyl-CoA isomerase
MAGEASLLSEQNGGVLTLTLNRPKANAFNQELIDALLDALRRAEAEASVRSILLTGAGRVFSAGQDVTALGAVDGQISFRRHLERTYNRLILRVRRLEKPVVGAINGAAAGAGLGLALAADIRLAARSARFVFGFTGIGLTTDSATSLMLPLLIGLPRASEVAFLNTQISADEALQWGLVNRVVDDADLAAQAAELAARLAAGPTRALGLTKRAFNHALLPHLEDVLDYEAHLQEAAGRTADHREGVKAFREKRQAVFTGS